MSDDTQSGTTPQEGDGTNESQEPQTFDAEYVAKLRKEAAKYRADAKANADAASKLAQFEQSQKTEAEKLTERAEQAERELATFQASALRSEIALEKGLSASQARRLLGSSREELEADADQLLADLGEQAKPRAPRLDPNQGRASQGTASNADLFAAAVEGSFTR